MSSLSPEARRLLDLSQGADDPDPGTRERVAHSLATRVALGGGAVLGASVLAKAAAAKTVAGSLGAGSTAPAAAASAGLVATAAKSLAAVGLATTIAAAGWQVTHAPATADGTSPRAALSVPSRTAPVKRDARPSTPRTSLVVPASNAGAAEVVPAPEPPKPEARRDVAPRKQGATAVSTESAPGATLTPDTLAAEARGLRGVQGALRDGDAVRALALLDEQRSLHAGGALEEERTAARVLALCQSDRVEEARAEAVRFAQRWPRSPLLPRVRSACRTP